MFGKPLQMAVVLSCESDADRKVGRIVLSPDNVTGDQVLRLARIKTLYGHNFCSLLEFKILCLKMWVNVGEWKCVD